MTKTDGESGLNTAMRRAFERISQSGCTLSPAEFFVLAFRIYVVGTLEGAATQVEASMKVAERVLGAPGQETS